MTVLSEHILPRQERVCGGICPSWMTSPSTIAAFLSRVYNTALVNCHLKKKNTGIFSGVAILHAPAAVLSSLRCVVQEVLVSRQTQGKPGEDTNLLASQTYLRECLLKTQTMWQNRANLVVLWWDGAERYPLFSLTLIKKKKLQWVVVKYWKWDAPN